MVSEKCDHIAMQKVNVIRKEKNKKRFKHITGLNQSKVKNNTTHSVTNKLWKHGICLGKIHNLLH